MKTCFEVHLEVCLEAIGKDAARERLRKLLDAAVQFGWAPVGSREEEEAREELARQALGLASVVRSVGSVEIA